MSCSLRTPATGTIKFNTPTKLSREGFASGVVVTEASADGPGERIGDEEGEGVGGGVTALGTEVLDRASGEIPGRAISPPRRLCKPHTTTTAVDTNSATTINQTRTIFLSCRSGCPIRFSLSDSTNKA